MNFASTSTDTYPAARNISVASKPRDVPSRRVIDNLYLIIQHSNGILIKQEIMQGGPKVNKNTNSISRL